MYHYVRDLKASRYPEIKGLTVRQFLEQIEFLSSYGNFISCKDAINAYTGGSLPENAILLTFDDGYIDHFTNVFPILKNRGIPAFFSMPGKILAERKVLDVNKIHFILASVPVEKLLPMVYEQLDFYRGDEWQIPKNEELYLRLAKPNRFDNADTIFVKRLLQAELPEELRGIITQNLFLSCVGISEESFSNELYLNREQIELMARSGMDWGIHGYEHYWLNRLTPNELENDIVKALDVFEGIVPKEGWTMCYPYGSYSGEVISCVREHGAVCGLATDVGEAELNDEFIYKLPRFDTNDFPPKSCQYKNYL